MTDPLDAQERARLLLDKHFVRDEIAGYIPMHYNQFEKDLAEQILQVEIEATKITPDMIEAGANALIGYDIWSGHTPSPPHEEYQIVAEAVLKAALGVE